jgi:hypothetical protein
MRECEISNLSVHALATYNALVTLTLQGCRMVTIRIRTTSIYYKLEI